MCDKRFFKKATLHAFDDLWRASKITIEYSFATNHVKGGKGRFYSPVNPLPCALKVMRADKGGSKV